MYITGEVAFFDIAVRGDKGWFFNLGYPAIYEINLKSGELRLETFVPMDYIMTEEAFGAIEFWNEKLYLAPRNEAKICIYDLRTKEIDFVELDLETYGDDKNYHLCNAVRSINGKLFFFPGRLHAIIELDPESLLVQYISDWYKEISSTSNEKKSNLLIFNNVHITADGECILPCWRSDVILKINVLNHKYSIVETKIKTELSDAVEIEDGYLVTAKKSKMIYRVSNSRVSAETLFETDSGSYLHLVASDLCVMPIWGSEIKIYNMNAKNVMTKFPFFDEKLKSQEWLNYKNLFLGHRSADGGKIILYMVRTGELLIIDVIQKKEKTVPIWMNDATKEAVRRNIRNMLMEKIFIENAGYKLADFVKMYESL